jgi:hypothetical protein
MAVAHRLAHGDEIGHEAVAGKAPHPSAATAEAGLYLIGDEQRAFLPDGFDRGAQKTRWVGEHTVARKDRIDQKRRRTDAALLHVGQCIADVTGKDFAGVCSRTRRRHKPHVAFFRKRKSERGRQFSQRAGDAMIGVCRDDESGAAGAGSRDAQSEIVGLAAGTGEHDVTDLGRKRREQFFCEVEHGLLQVARMRVEHGGLPRNRLHDVRVAVPDRCDVVVGVQIAVSGGVMEPDAFTADELDRLVVE